MAARRNRPGFKLSDITGEDADSATAAGLGAGVPTVTAKEWQPRRPVSGTPFANFHKIVDPSGALNFNGKAILHASGVDFSNGASFAINMDQLELQDELGKGAYGTVKRVLHRPTKVAMAMKEIRLELDESKLNAILMELDILHRAVHPSIVEFYGAFFIETCVYYCMEFMDAGSLDKLYGVGVPEDVLARIVASMVRGLKFLKDDLQIIHRDVKPTNVLVNMKGQVKLCDFGVSGQLEKSLAKTNIGCQSYMAPERIKGESQNALSTYTVSSDVWSVGLATIEIGLGAYPYPPETYSNVFAQLQAIVHGDPPVLPAKYTETACDWVSKCLVKRPEGRASYAELLEHPFLVNDAGNTVDMAAWVSRAVAWRDKQREKERQAVLAKEAPPPHE
ncbi:kinase-like protein [Vararia minispora EC-137]|uniref:Kinase-like protein n=1 Tax=Vararia minispora EC-137 TaxID=1314806 RepID=A0ACB8QZA2_9AGAM|nr:kinase-like protein [Vararia minispora EC-137]